MRRIVALSTLLVFLAVPSLPWGPVGHRAIGRIAERHLTPETARQVAALLGPDRLTYVGTWADDIRSDPAWAKADSWHWVTIQPGQTYAESKKNPTGDVIEAIARFERILADPNAPRIERQQALKWLVHLVGDMHQPLHVGRGDDRGGNEVMVLWFNEPSNLHSVWDSGLIGRAELSSIELAEKVDVATPEEVQAWRSSGPLEWAAESSALLDKVYVLGDRRLSWRYIFDHWPTVEKRIAQAGVRLAAILDRALGPDRDKAEAWLPR